MTSARLAAMADAGVALKLGADCISLNPAGLSPTFQHKFEMHMFHTKPFGLDELHIAGIAACYRKSRFSHGLCLHTFGDARYRENLFCAATAFQLSPSFCIGAAFRYGVLKIRGYGSTGSMMFDVGAILNFSENISWGFSMKNCANAKIGTTHELLPTRLVSGFCFSPQDALALNIDVSKDTRFPLDLCVGAQYSPLSPLTLRVGVGYEPTRFCAGFSLAFSRFRFDYGFSSHNELGFTHLFSIGYF